ncbi:MAG: endonuclease domain-containing protein [Bacteroidota bacterium]|nr:endonuclease domain-containing protein [Bacteroidota bacterium]
MLHKQFKVCKVCKIEKEIEAFAPNQYGKDNRVLRRPVCRECYAKKVKADPKQKAEFEAKHPRPQIGEEFTCPICLKCFIREHKNDVVLDHSHIDGSIRGWLCSSCNTSIGKFNDDPEVLQRGIDWIKNGGNMQS